MRERNRNIDILRAMSLLLILIYHSWVVCGSQPIKWSAINMIVSLGGEIGVTAFFALSGYGIYCSLHGMEKQGKISVPLFFAKRVKRIIPQYYLCLLVVLLFTGGAVYLSTEHVLNIVSHIFFVHNFWPDYFGAINGVLWTMGIIVQFYIIAIPLYRGMKRFGWKFWICSVVVTIVIKYIVYAYVIPGVEGESAWYFIYGRQLFTALDNFVTGMVVAWFVVEKKKTLKKMLGIVLTVTGIILLLFICRLGQRYGIHTNNISGYTWHSMLVAVLGLIAIGFSSIPIHYDNIVVKGILWIASYEYGIYLWHLVMYNNLVEKSSIIQQLIANGYRKIVFVIFITLAIGVGFLFTKMTNTLKLGSWGFKKESN